MFDLAIAQTIGQSVLDGHFQLVETDAPVPLELPATEADMDSVVAAVLAVGRERKAMLDRLRSALTTGQDEQALTLARELCNLPKGASHDGQTTVH
jgi:hypothetical protein